MRRAFPSLALGAALLAGCATPPVVTNHPSAQGRASEAFELLRGRLQTRLTEAMAAGGPDKAIEVCKLEADELTAAIGQERGMRLGRTSFRLRNRANAPRAWVASLVAAGEGKRADEVRVVTVDLGDRVGVLQPIPTGPLCATCHGDRATIAPGVAAALAQQYPEDQAVGFTAGALRGFFWAEVPKT